MVTSTTVSRVAVYARFSSEKQSDTSIEDQVARARAWLVTNGTAPDSPRVFSDYAVSGTVLERPGYQALLSAIEAGELSMVVAESADRLFRDNEDSARFAKLVRFHRVELQCLDGTQLRADGKGDRLLYAMRSAISTQYLDDLADKTLRGLEGNATRGTATGGVPFGYVTVPSEAWRTGHSKRRDSRIEINPERAAVVRRIFALYAAGTSLAGVAAQLNADGVPPPRAHIRRTGHGWMHSAVRAMLLNDCYRGVWAFGKREWVKHPSTRRRVPQTRAGGPRVSQTRPELAIVDAATWDAVQTRFASNTMFPAKRRRFMLSGILHCAACGARMQLTGSSSRPYFSCSNAQKRRTCDNRRNMPAGEAESGILASIRARLEACMDRVRELAVEEIRAWAAARPTKRAELGRQRDEVGRLLTNVVNALADTGSDLLKAKLRELESRKVILDAELARVSAIAPVLPSPAEIARRVVALAELATAPPDLAREDLRALLHEGRIDCGPREARGFTLRWSIQPAALLGTESQQPPLSKSGSGCWTTIVAGAGFAGDSTLLLPCEIDVG